MIRFGNKYFESCNETHSYVIKFIPKYGRTTTEISKFIVSRNRLHNYMQYTTIKIKINFSTYVLIVNRKNIIYFRF